MPITAHNDISRSWLLSVSYMFLASTNTALHTASQLCEISLLTVDASMCKQTQLSVLVFMTQEGIPSCVACASFHSHEKCCCGEQPQELPSYIPGKLLRSCAKDVCGFAIESYTDQTWVYSFEAERVSCSTRHAKQASSACKGIVGCGVKSLATSLPHVSREPRNMLAYIRELGDHANTRPVFQRLFIEADDKLAYVTDLSPHVYYGSGDGIRSSFCSHTSALGQCFPCGLL